MTSMLVVFSLVGVTVGMAITMRRKTPPPAAAAMIELINRCSAGRPRKHHPTASR
jgi:hypothetical protein